jgi:hypothetical protein
MTSQNRGETFAYLKIKKLIFSKLKIFRKLFSSVDDIVYGDSDDSGLDEPKGQGPSKIFKILLVKVSFGKLMFIYIKFKTLFHSSQL